MVNKNRSHVVSWLLALTLLAGPALAQQNPGMPCCPEYDNGNSSVCPSNNCAINFQSRSPVQKVGRDSAVTLTLTAPNYASYVSLRLVHANNGTVFTVAFSPAVKFPAGSTPTWTNTANAIDILTLYWDGANWYGIVQNAFA